MSASTPHQRQISLSQFPAFAHNLAHALTTAGIAPRDITTTCATHLSAKCVVCDAQVDGRELAALLTDEELPEHSPLKRLPRGYCINAECRSGYYEFAARPHPAVDWSQIATTEAAAPAELPAATGWWVTALRAGSRKVADAFTWRFAAGLAVLLALWIWRQWWTGGSIPFLREAKSYISEGAASDPALMVDDDDK